MFYESIKQAVKNGSNVILECDNFTNSSIEELIFLAAQSKSHITITNCSKLSTSEMEEMSNLGRNLITFDMRKVK